MPLPSAIDSEESENEKDKPEKTAKIVVTSCDDGHFGFSSCGSCGNTLPEDEYFRCPHCGIKLGGIEHSPSFGGQDYY